MSKWVYRDTPDIRTYKEHSALQAVNDSTLKILVSRGFTDPKEIEKFLFGGLKDQHDPRLMKDAELAVEIMMNAIRNEEKIVVYGDYDCDGVSSTAVMTMLLQQAGADVGFFTNNRFIHGYGMCPTGVDDLLDMYPDVKLIVTVDNGISAHAGVQYAKDKGIKVVVTDHHDQAPTLPPADAIVDPKRHDCEYPFKGLCGAGVAFKLMLLMYWRLGKPLSLVYETLDIVAMATVADIVPLIDENRIFVRKGLEMIKDEKRMVYQIFREVTEVKAINAHHTIGFVYGPMVNAIGRLVGDPRQAIEMFFEEDAEKVRETILYLKEVNEERKRITEEQYEQALTMIEGELDPSTGLRSGGKGLQYVNVVYHPDFHEGVIGLIAGRLKELYNRPFYVFTKHHGTCKGSGRGIDGFHLKKAMDEIPHLLKGYGGHAKACGLSVDEENLQAFEEEMNKLAMVSLTEDDFQKIYLIDCALSPSDVTLDLVDDLKELEPFGEAFPKPVLSLENFQADEAFPVFKGSPEKIHYMLMGTEKQHLKLKSGKLDLVMWRASTYYLDLGMPKQIKAIGYPDINVWQNVPNVQFMVDGMNLLPAS